MISDLFYVFFCLCLHATSSHEPNLRRSLFGECRRETKAKFFLPHAKHRAQRLKMFRAFWRKHWDRSAQCFAIDKKFKFAETESWKKFFRMRNFVICINFRFRADCTADIVLLPSAALFMLESDNFHINEPLHRRNEWMNLQRAIKFHCRFAFT